MTKTNESPMAAITAAYAAPDEPVNWAAKAAKVVEVASATFNDLGGETMPIDIAAMMMPSD